MTPETLRSDPVNQHIIALLQENARTSFNAIGSEVGLSAAAVKRRVDRLEDAGIITGYRATVARGDETEAFVELFCRTNTNPGTIRAMVDGLTEVVGAYTVSGEADAVIHVRCAGTGDLERVIEAIRSHPNAERTRSSIVLSSIVERTFS